MVHGHVSLAVIVGLVSACAFAASNALQHRVAGTVPPDVERAVKVLAHVARKPTWLLATTISFCALLLHATALRLGSIALVQPLMLVGVVLAVPLRAALDLKTPTWRELRGVLVTAVGLGTFLSCVDPATSGASPSVTATGALVAIGFATALVVLLVSPRLSRRPRAQAALLGSASGVMFGLTAGLLKLLGSVVGMHATPLVAAPVAALVGLGLLGTAMNQRAYQLAPLSLSMPLVNVLGVLTAVTFGVAVFHEPPGHTPVLLALQGTALVCLAVGLRLIARIGEGDGVRVQKSVAGQAAAR
jgi:drug/metabolite transporter (DMT)-like permease